MISKLLLLAGIFLTIFFGTITVLKAKYGEFIHWFIFVMLSLGVVLIISYFIF